MFVDRLVGSLPQVVRVYIIAGDGNTRYRLANHLTTSQYFIIQISFRYGSHNNQADVLEVDTGIKHFNRAFSGPVYKKA